MKNKLLKAVAILFLPGGSLILVYEIYKLVKGKNEKNS